MIPTRTSRSRAIAAALLVLTFVAGAAAGVVADRLLAPAPTMRTRMVRDVSGVLDKLGLTPDQRVRAEAILQRSGPRVEEAMREAAERLRMASDSVDAELRALLSPEQRLRLDSFKRAPVFLLKRVTPGSTTVDTVVPRRRDSIKRP